jgi:putative membrane protein insertion efficiency factor
MTRILLAMLEFYRRWLSPTVHAVGGGGGCRFVPTCSEYASIAIATHGPFRGTGLAIWRLLRCHPFCRGGLDPVPTAAKSKESALGPSVSNTRASAHLPHEPLP